MSGAHMHVDRRTRLAALVDTELLQPVRRPARRKEP
jgi:hypothetical protein